MSQRLPTVATLFDTMSGTMDGSPETRFHVTPSANRDSILRFGLDWSRMAETESGIASGGPGRPELDGIFLTEPFSDAARFFVRFGRGRRIETSGA